MITHGLVDILRQRAGQGSFHIASEKAVRVEFMRFSKDQTLGPLRVDGDVVVTCLEGSFLIGDPGVAAPAMTQIVVPEGEVLKVTCMTDGAVQIIWAPPFAATRPA